MDTVTDGGISLAHKEQAQEPLQIVEQCLALLKRKDDTSRLVGLAMLLSVSKQLKTYKVMEQCMEALNPMFLDRLLKAGEIQESSQEAKDMVELAVNVINVFVSAIPNVSQNPFVVDRIPLLMHVISNSSAETIETILNILLVLATKSQGSRKILQCENLGRIIDTSVNHSVASQVLDHAFSNSISDIGVIRDSLERVCRELCNRLDKENCQRALRHKILSILAGLVTRIPSELFPPDLAWVKSVYRGIRGCIIGGPSKDERWHCTIVAACLLHTYPSDILFKSDYYTGKSKTPSDEKPFVYLFLRLVTIDIRVTYPSLLEQLESPSYTSTVQFLAAGFDVITSFVQFLLAIEELGDIGIDMDLVLKLRQDIGETFGLTVEFLRDRWDAAFTNCDPGLSSEQDAPKEILSGSDLIGSGLERDALIIGAVRALSLWVREDNGLRYECGELMDVFLGLWARSKNSGVDYRPWITGALGGILEETHGRRMFQELAGWKTIWEDLKYIHKHKQTVDDGKIQLAIAEAHLLVNFVRTENFMNEEWAREIVVQTGNMEQFPTASDGLVLDMLVLSLASACASAVQRHPEGRMEEELLFLRKQLELVLDGNTGVGEGEDEVGRKEVLADILGDILADLQRPVGI